LCRCRDGCAERERGDWDGGKSFLGKLGKLLRELKEDVDRSMSVGKASLFFEGFRAGRNKGTAN
jgi:hypothetical protein